MSVSPTATPLQAILVQLQPAIRPAAAVDVSTMPAARRTMASAPPAGVTPNGAASLNPNAPRGTYLNIVV